ncbi:Ankrd49 [Symbiodinium sp. CCMP2592]|nr:Ankrd49 [Symbiodinium sp. CCMP2592]
MSSMEPSTKDLHVRMASGKHITMHLALRDRRTVKELKEELWERKFCCHSPRRQLLLHDAELLHNDMRLMRLQPPLDLTLVLIDFVTDQVDKLAEAAARGALDEVQRLLQQCFQDPNQIDSAGRTALHRASATGEVGAAELLVEAQAELDKVDCEGWTSLHFAVLYGQQTSIQFLLQKRADSQKQNNVAQTPVELAAIYGNDSVRLLLLSSLRPPSQRTSSARPYIFHGRPSLLHDMIIHGHDEKVRQMLHVVSEMSHPYDHASEPDSFFETLWSVTSAGSLPWDSWWERLPRRLSIMRQCWAGRTSLLYC